MRIIIEPRMPKPTLWLAGNSPIIEYISQLATVIGFCPHHIPNQSAMASSALFPHSLSHQQMTLPGPNDFVLFFCSDTEPTDITLLENSDQTVKKIISDQRELLSQMIQSEACYFAIVADNGLQQTVLNELSELGWRSHIQKLRVTTGIDLGARTMQEIALSLIAELTLVRRKGIEAVIQQPAEESITHCSELSHA